MNKFLKNAALVAAIFVISACSKPVTGRIVLQGEVEGDPSEVVVVSFLPGQSIGYHFPEVNDGKFEFSLDDVEGFADLIVSVGGVEFGARINAEDTLRMNFVVREFAEDVEVRYDGANEKEGRMWNDFYDTYERFSEYNLKPDRDTCISWDESLALLERNDSIFRSVHSAEMDKYFRHRADLAYGLTKAIILEQKAYENGVDPCDWPEYSSLLDRVDPGDPDEVTFPLVIRWMDCKKKSMPGSEIDRNVEFIRKYGQKVTCPEVREMLAGNMTRFCLEKINTDSLEIYEPLIEALDGFVPEGSATVEKCRAKLAAALASKQGSEVPDTGLEAPDGEKLKLSSLFGKVLYVDIWATWCGPCRNEIPFLKSLAEKFADDSRICFVSISTDSTNEPWAEFISEEKPFWPQYRFTETGKNDFCGKLGISAIPRFMLIDTEGRFIDADCPRPSDERTESIIREVLR